MCSLEPTIFVLEQEIRKIIYTSEDPSYTKEGFKGGGSKLHGHVSMMFFLSVLFRHGGMRRG